MRAHERKGHRFAGTFDRTARALYARRLSASHAGHLRGVDHAHGSLIPLARGMAMMKNNANPTFAPLLTILALVAWTAPGCELFGDPDELLAINVPITYTVPQTLVISIPDQSIIGDRPQGADETWTIDIPPVYLPDINLAEMDSRLSRGASIVDRVEIVGVRLDVSNNSLNVPIQPITLRVGSPSASYESALDVAVTQTLQPGFTGSSEATIVDTNRIAAGEALGNLQFGMGMGTSLVVPAGVTPQGSANADLTLSLNIRIKP